MSVLSSHFGLPEAVTSALIASGGSAFWIPTSVFVSSNDVSCGHWVSSVVPKGILQILYIFVSISTAQTTIMSESYVLSLVWRIFVANGPYQKCTSTCFIRSPSEILGYFHLGFSSVSCGFIKMPTIPPMYFPSVPFPINFSFDANIAYILLFTMSSQLNELRINIPTKLDGVNATLISANERHVIAVNLYRDQERLERRQGTENIVSISSTC